MINRQLKLSLPRGLQDPHRFRAPEILTGGNRSPILAA